MHASVLAAERGDGKQYGCSRDFAASLGLVPRQYSTGGRANLLGISKRGDKNIRRLLVQCARAYMQRLEHQSGRLADWVGDMLKRRHSNVVACALANKLARIAWALPMLGVLLVGCGPSDLEYRPNVLHAASLTRESADRDPAEIAEQAAA